MSMNLKDDILKAAKDSKRITDVSITETKRKMLKYTYFSDIDRLLSFINKTKELKKEDIQKIDRITLAHLGDSYELFYWEEE